MLRPGFEPGTTGSEGIEKSIYRSKIALVANLRQFATEGNIKSFYEYLIKERGISEKTAREYVSALNRPYRETRNAQKAYRLFAKFLMSRGIISENFAEKILKIIKVKKANVDLYIPSIDEVRQTLEIVREYSKNIYFIYRLALESGARLSEILTVLRNPDRDVCEDICYYPLSWERGFKSSFYIFHITQLKKIDITQ